MNVESGNSNSKRNTFFAASVSVFNAIVVKNTVVNAFNRSARLHFELPSVRAARNFSKKTQIPVGFGINNPAVVGRRTVETRKTNKAVSRLSVHGCK